MSTRVAVTAAEWWELQARTEAVQSAEMRLALAKVAHGEAQRRILTAHGLPVDGDYDVIRESDHIPPEES